MVAASTRGAGWVTVALAEAVQPEASVTVTLYVPAARLLSVDPLPLFGVQLYVRGAVPPETDTLTDPLLLPEQGMGVGVAAAVSGWGCVMVVFAV